VKNIDQILQQAKELGTIEWVYFEGGEPFLFYAVLLQGVQRAAQIGFRVGIVSNAYWATDTEDALQWLKPFAGLIQDLSISSDFYHSAEKLSEQANNAKAAAKKLGISVGYISISFARRCVRFVKRTIRMRIPSPARCSMAVRRNWCVTMPCRMKRAMLMPVICAIRLVVPCARASQRF
jgi:hypothetical protein